jgi:hypothetical protein
VRQVAATDIEWIALVFFSLSVAVRGRATCRALGIDVRRTAAWQAVSQHDAVTADQELTDAGLVVARAGFDD